tara:strand:- start:679 stop:1167 length:489 start_codon:yes stop_codon:yes gene_type:complete
MNPITLQHLVNFVLIATQRINNGKATEGQLHHDMNAISAFLTGNKAVLVGFVPMIQSIHWDKLIEALTSNPDPDPKGQELHFFGGQPVAQNPIDPNHLFATPESLDNLLSYALRFNGSERQIALTMMTMSLNLAHRLFETALGNEVKPDHHHINKPLNHSSD